MATFTFTNKTGAAVPPSPTVSHTSQEVTAIGMQGHVTDVTVTLTGLTHTYPADLDFLLVGPDGESNLVFMSDAGQGQGVNGLDLTFTDTAADQVSEVGPIVTGTYKPTDYAGTGMNDVPETNESFGSSVTEVNAAGPYGAVTFGSAFDGISPNGNWSLYMADDYLDEDNGTLGAWSISVQTSNDGALVTGTAAADALKVTSTSAHAGSFVFNGDGAVEYSGLSTFSFNGRGGNDTFVGGDEIDLAAGGKNDDKLIGNGGKDTLRGGKGNDTLDGGTGADRISGGRAQDKLYAGDDTAKDVFFFDKGDSGKTLNTADVIHQFHGGEDKINLSALDVKWSDITLDTKGSDVTVSINYKGGHNADMLIDVLHIDHLHKADFIL